jgi:hypothetical protein
LDTNENTSACANRLIQVADEGGPLRPGMAVAEVAAVSFRRSAQLLDAPVPPRVIDAPSGSRVVQHGRRAA